jgi:glyoxylase-like metal-dependent hydrolase (beta-lactamase superfamily II)
VQDPGTPSETKSQHMIHVILPVGQLRCNCSIFGDEQSREAIVIDPGDELSKITEVLDKHQLKVKAIIITHGHIDHVAGAAQLRALTGAPVYMNENDHTLLDALDVQAGWLGAETPERPEIDIPAREGQAVKLSDADFNIILTPGHTQGSLSVWIPQEQKLIAGDTLFRETVGRTDLPGGDSRKILSSIKTRLLPLPDSTIVIPGHGLPTTIAHEKEFNPFLQGL